LIHHHEQFGFPLINFSLPGFEYLEQFRSVCEAIGVEFDPAAASDFYATELITHGADESELLEGDAAATFDYLVRNQIRSITRREMHLLS
jgi:hypothetical protein